MLFPMAFEKIVFLPFFPLLSILGFNLVKVHNYLFFLNFIEVFIYGSLHPYRHSVLC